MKPKYLTFPLLLLIFLCFTGMSSQKPDARRNLMCETVLDYHEGGSNTEVMAYDKEGNLLENFHADTKTIINSGTFGDLSRYCRENISYMLLIRTEDEKTPRDEDMKTAYVTFTASFEDEGTQMWGQYFLEASAIFGEDGAFSYTFIPIVTSLADSLPKGYDITAGHNGRQDGYINQSSGEAEFRYDLQLSLANNGREIADEQYNIRFTIKP